MAARRQRLLLELEMLNIEEQIIFLKLLKRRRRRRIDRRWGVRPLHQTREHEGEFVTLVEQMRDMDEEMHFRYFRMSASRFDDLVRRLQPFISHQSTHGMPIDLRQRLAVTLVC